jgi:hypothetical protein
MYVLCLLVCILPCLLFCISLIVSLLVLSLSAFVRTRTTAQADDLRAQQEEEIKRAQLNLLRQKKKEKELRRTMAESANAKAVRLQ